MLLVKVGLLTTWNTQCGVAEHSRALVEAFARRSDVELVVLGSRNYGGRSIAPHEDYVIPVFDVPSWNDEGHDELDVDAILALDLDLLHVEYEALLYNVGRLNELLRRFRGPKFVTWHDANVPEDLEWQRFDQAFTHRAGVGAGDAVVIPLAIREMPGVVRTFGLGRTREDIVRPICEHNGWVFESLSSSETPLGGQPWMPWRELHDWLRGADAIVLWYDDNAAAGSSLAARTAVATRRPVIVNDTTWFRELPQQSGSFYKLKDDPVELEATLREILRPDTMIGRWSTDAIVDQQIGYYQAALQAKADEPPAPPPGRLRAALQTIRRGPSALARRARSALSRWVHERVKRLRRRAAAGASADRATPPSV
jgi:hypothetical protein